MAEITLKPKVTLKRKGDYAQFSFNEKLKIELIWSSDTDLDLCLFYKKTDGSFGGVFSNEFRQNKEDLGSLEKFPFILHKGDKKTPRPGGEENEEILVKNLDLISEAYVCVLNFTAGIENKSVSFAENSGKVEITSDTKDNLEVLADSSDLGHLYVVCKITNDNGEKRLINERRVLTIGDAFEQIPGFSLICNY